MKIIFKRNRKKAAGSPAWRVHKHKTAIPESSFLRLSDWGPSPDTRRKH